MGPLRESPLRESPNRGGRIRRTRFGVPAFRNPHFKRSAPSSPRIEFWTQMRALKTARSVPGPATEPAAFPPPARPSLDQEPPSRRNGARFRRSDAVPALNWATELPARSRRQSTQCRGRQRREGCVQVASHRPPWGALPFTLRWTPRRKGLKPPHAIAAPPLGSASGPSLEIRARISRKISQRGEFDGSARGVQATTPASGPNRRLAHGLASPGSGPFWKSTCSSHKKGGAPFRGLKATQSGQREGPIEANSEDHGRADSRLDGHLIRSIERVLIALPVLSR